MCLELSGSVTEPLHFCVCSWHDFTGPSDHRRLNQSWRRGCQETSRNIKQEVWLFMLTGPQSEHWNAVCLLLCVEEVELRFDGHLMWQLMKMIRLMLRSFPQIFNDLHEFLCKRQSTYCSGQTKWNIKPPLWVSVFLVSPSLFHSSHNILPSFHWALMQPNQGLI